MNHWKASPLKRCCSQFSRCALSRSTCDYFRWTLEDVLHLMTFGAKGADPPGVNQTTIPQKIRLDEKHVLSEATPLQKCPCKKLFAVKKLQKNRGNFTSANSCRKSSGKAKTETRKKSILLCDLKMCKRGGALEKSGYLTSCTPQKIFY